jgi:glycosyltransferase involved in cell wall biosynthesis
LNILFVSDVSISKVIGGAERVLYEQSTRLAQKGHNVHIITRRLPAHESDHEIIHSVHEWRYDVDQSSILSFYGSTQLNSRRLFESLHEKNNFECINLHQPFSSLGVVNSPLSIQLKKIYTCHSLSFEEYQSRNPKTGSPIGNLMRWINTQGRKEVEKKVLKASDRIIVLSQYTQDKLWKAYKIPSQKILIIPGGVDLERFRPAGDRMEIRRRLNIPEDKMVLLTVRNLVSRMGLENLIAAMKDVIESMPDTCLIIGGSGILKDELVKLSRRLNIEGNIKFAGFIPDQDLPDYYRAADAFILPTLELEGFGLVTLEAMACGTPVLGTPIGGTKEILGKFDSSYLFKDTGSESIAALIIEKYQQFKESPDLWKSLSSQCRNFVETNYSWETNVDATERIFHRLSSEP